MVYFFYVKEVSQMLLAPKIELTSKEKVLLTKYSNSQTAA
jgi:hypothetical protein